MIVQTVFTMIPELVRWSGWIEAIGLYLLHGIFISKLRANQHVDGTRNNLKLDGHFIEDFAVESKTHTRRGLQLQFPSLSKDDLLTFY